MGVDSNSIGNFNTVLLNTNPQFELTGPNAYSGTCTKYSVVIANVPDTRKTRIGFRYYVPDGGPTEQNGLGIGIDKFQFISN